MYDCFRFLAHEAGWNIIHQSGFLGWLLTPVKQDPAVVQEFPIYIQIGLKASDMYLDIPVCAINTVLFLVFFGVGPYLASVGIKSSTQRKIGTVLILAGLGWYFALRNYYDVMFITKVVYTLVALAFAGIGTAIGTRKRNAIYDTKTS